MRIRVNGNDLFVDIEGAGLVPDGDGMREKPTLILLHGGPGADHSIFKPAFSQLSDLCQIVYYDHLGNGRSDLADPDDWTLDRWGDDVRGLCDALGIVKPIVFGASFGGFVAQSYATRHPDHARALILSVTAAKVDFEMIYEAFGRVGGPEAETVARAYWSNPTVETRTAFAQNCLPLYAHTGLDPSFMTRMIDRPAVGLHFNGPDNEQGRFDFREALQSVPCPTLVLSGAHDPIMPPVFQDEIAQHIPDAKLHRFEDGSHLLEKDVPEAFFTHLRHFIQSL
jgi:proline iminopeptidase